MDYKIFKSGTDIRGVASEGVKGQAINLTNEAITGIANGFLLWCEKNSGKKANELKLAVGHDSRISADRINTVLKSVFVNAGATVYDCGLASTPSMFMAVLNLELDASIQITASHHPFNRNGLKFFSKKGGFESSDISFILEQAQNRKTVPLTDNGIVIESDHMQIYSKSLCDMIIKEVGSEKPLEGFKIVVDAGNGAGGFYASEVLGKLGADVSASQFLEPDGMFPNHVPNPEDKDAMESISRATVNAKADLGVIFDTDVDRSAAVDSDGKEINRNALIAIASIIALEGNKGGTIVTDSITSDGLKDFIQNDLSAVHNRFKRGYKNVINEAIRLNNEGINCPLAIETSGHAAMRENYFLDDGAYLITKIIILTAKLRKQGKTLQDLLSGLKEAVEEREVRFPILAQNFKEVGETVIAKLEEFAKEKCYKVADDSKEGIRISFDKDNGDGWLLLRLSVHDPIMPLNIESNSTGGVEIISNKLKEFFTLLDCNQLDTTSL